jgi:glutathione peroxidase
LLGKKKGPKVLLISNIAMNCGHAKVHFREFKELAEEFGSDLEIMLFPSNSFNQQPESDSQQDVAIKIRDKHEWDHHVYEKVLVNSGDATHPLIAHLKDNSGKNGKGMGLVKWNFDKWIVNQAGKMVNYSTGKSGELKKSPQELASLIETHIEAAKKASGKEK